MPFLRHIVEPLLRKNLDSLRAELPPPSAPPLPSQVADSGRAIHPVFGDLAAANEYRAQIDESQRNGRGSFVRGFEDGTSVLAGPMPGDDVPETYGAAPEQPVASYTQSHGVMPIDYKRPATAPSGTAKTEYDPKGLVNKKGTSDFDPRMLPGNAGSFVSAMGSMQQMGPAWNAFQQGAWTGKDQGLDESGKPLETLIPNMPVTPAPAASGRNVIPMGKRGEAVGLTESGQSIDSYGKKLGYLQQTPALVTPYGDVPLRASDRRADIVSPAEPSSDALHEGEMKKRYKEHLDVFEENRGAFPKGYFKGKSEKQRDDIKAGVDALRTQMYGTKT